MRVAANTNAQKEQAMRAKQPTRYGNPLEELFYHLHENANTLKEVWNCSYATARKKLKNPMFLTLGEIYEVEACGIVSFQEVINAIKDWRDLEAQK